jgi:hypothetical protein
MAKKKKSCQEIVKKEKKVVRKLSKKLSKKVSKSVTLVMGVTLVTYVTFVPNIMAYLSWNFTRRQRAFAICV